MAANLPDLPWIVLALFFIWLTTVATALIKFAAWRYCFGRAFTRADIWDGRGDFWKGAKTAFVERVAFASLVVMGGIETGVAELMMPGLAWIALKIAANWGTDSMDELFESRWPELPEGLTIRRAVTRGRLIALLLNLMSVIFGIYAGWIMTRSYPPQLNSWLISLNQFATSALQPLCR